MKTIKPILILVLIFTSNLFWAQPYVGEIKLFAGSFAPAGWAFCDGAVIPISENETLFQLIGTTYGGDGQSTFALPDLRGRVPVSYGTAANGVTYNLGEMTGVEGKSLTMANMPVHAHNAQLMVSDQRATHAIPTTSSSITTTGLASGRSFRPNQSYNNATGNIFLDAFTTNTAGFGIPISIVKPYVAINYIISLYGVFPNPN